MGIQINGQTDRISAVDGSFSIQDLAEVNVAGVATASNFKSGTSNVHSTGYDCTNINATGIVTAASANFTGNVSVGGTLTYQDVTNIDSVGVITARAGIELADNIKIKLGTSDDLQIYHDTSGSGNSIIKEEGTGELRLGSNNAVRITKHDSETCALFTIDGSAEFYYDNVKKFETHADGLHIGDGGNLDMPHDSSKIVMGASDDLQIYHNGSHTYVDNTTGNYNIRQFTDDGNVSIYNDDGSGGTTVYLQCTGSDGAVRLNHYGNEKFITKSDGVDITGELQCDTLDVDGNADFGGGKINFDNGGNVLDFADNVAARFGTGDDLRIYHDGSHSYVKDAGTGELRLEADAGGVRIQRASGHTGIFYNVGGQVELYYDNTKRIETNSNGVRVTGRIEINGSNGRIEYNNTANTFEFFTNGNKVAEFLSSGHFVPGTNNTYDLGSNLYRWRNIYTNDLNLSNEGSTNDVDGTWGNYTIQEGENDLYLINRRNGKKYKFNLTEVN